MPRAWTEDEDARLREALRLNPTVGASRIEHRFPTRSRSTLSKRLRKFRGCSVHDLREPPEPSKRREAPVAATRSAAAHSKLASTPMPPRGYYPAEIAWAEATEHNPSARPIQRLEARLILSLHEGRERWA